MSLPSHVIALPQGPAGTSHAPHPNPRLPHPLSAVLIPPCVTPPPAPIRAVSFFPLSLLTLGAGFVYSEAFGLATGVGLATAYCFLGSYLGAVLSFLRSRYMTRDLIRKFSRRYPIVRAIDNAFKTRGLRVLFLLRLSPVIPYSALNYIGGVTGATAEDFCLSLFGILPDTALTAFIGATAGSLLEGLKGGGSERWIIVGSLTFGIFVGVLGIAAIGIYARKELREVSGPSAGEDGREVGFFVCRWQSQTRRVSAAVQRAYHSCPCPFSFLRPKVDPCTFIAPLSVLTNFASHFTLRSSLRRLWLTIVLYPLIRCPRYVSLGSQRWRPSSVTTGTMAPCGMFF